MCLEIHTCKLFMTVSKKVVCNMYTLNNGMGFLVIGDSGGDARESKNIIGWGLSSGSLF